MARTSIRVTGTGVRDDRAGVRVHRTRVRLKWTLVRVDRTCFRITRAPARAACASESTVRKTKTMYHRGHSEHSAMQRADLEMEPSNHTQLFSLRSLCSLW